MVEGGKANLRLTLVVDVGEGTMEKPRNLKESYWFWWLS